jgi:hypothetical protein
MKAFDIVGYTYQAEILCKECARRAARRNNPDPAPVESWLAETELNDWANTIGLDREEEESYDSNDFPKVIFASEVQEGETCGECGEALL